jgi:hypothetical protein
VFGELDLRPECEGDRRQDEGGVTNGAQVHEPRAVGERLGYFRRRCERESCFARAAGAGEGHHPGPIDRQQAHDVDQLLLPPHERIRRRGQIRLVERPERRKVAGAQLVHARLADVLQAMKAKVA